MPLTDRRHPALNMIYEGSRLMAEQGAQVIYALPDPRWRRAIRRHERFRTTMLEHWSRSLLDLEPVPLADGFTAKPTKLWRRSAEVDDLLLRAHRFYGVSRQREASTLGRKIKVGFVRCHRVERDGRLVGLVVGKDKEHQFMICDVITGGTPDEIENTFAAGVNMAIARHRKKAPIDRVGLVLAGFLEPAARRFGLAATGYRYLFATYVLDPSLDPDEFAPERWYVTDCD